jgi:hypothetical protein
LLPLVISQLFGPDILVGHSSNPAPGALIPPILPPQNGLLFLDRARFAEAFAAEVARTKAALVADSQVPWGMSALTGFAGSPPVSGSGAMQLPSTRSSQLPARACNALDSSIPSARVVLLSRLRLVLRQPEHFADSRGDSITRSVVACHHPRNY